MISEADAKKALHVYATLNEIKRCAFDKTGKIEISYKKLDNALWGIKASRLNVTSTTFSDEVYEIFKKYITQASEEARAYLEGILSDIG